MEIINKTNLQCDKDCLLNLYHNIRIYRWQDTRIGGHLYFQEIRGNEEFWYYFDENEQQIFVSIY